MHVRSCVDQDLFEGNWKRRKAPKCLRRIRFHRTRNGRREDLDLTITYLGYLLQGLDEYNKASLYSIAL